ncbi:MAG: hypothetical protein IM585_08965 [Pseudanabaena sp. M135S2SP2A07QC]|jgi:hypothetical protein|uniref:hypothetical protein n=1 Tax=Microcystis sp. M158S2 TaxID=2771152 RepID=UPI00258A3022|nr:hypothetical protein [Microcystis sp. M158S2]MCA6533870.1 hypothetical protein [Pseudanabaena sp. M176S2SP2A07QC]MCA6550343.1 hypothetical protein [Pseudanabaena sp. M152S2SP2A07QC]MCA6552125.1 hypothetical protein [Pseudanabaena sp. M135S2SP2A07QC]MCA6565583.1 hypothetical protein [Pseudanabaena sp. M151S2SP2A07QC]MCA6568560.1 hypothetical protein [Pseudanabaena sp. M065S1SP2A07QC]MCA6577460.1 hypothetical protein [Pseudanabaena sp. M085S1SP2A07QC]
MELVYITGIIVSGIVIIVLAFRHRITDLVLGVSEKQGDRERKGTFIAKAAPPKLKRKPKSPSDIKQSNLVDISGNISFGVWKTEVSHWLTRITKNINFGIFDTKVTDNSNSETLQANPEKIQAHTQGDAPKLNGFPLEQQSTPKSLPEVEDK